MKIIDAKGAPKAIGPYSQAIMAGDFLFLSGSIPLHPETGEVYGDEVLTQTERVLENIKAVLKEAGLDFCNVVKSTVYLTDLNNFSKMNEIYIKYFGEHKPARSTIQISALPRNVLVEIEVIAFAGKNG